MTSHPFPLVDPLMPPVRRALFITTTFFPHPSVGGVRMTQWARCLPAFGWEAHVLARYYGHFATPEMLARHLHPSIRVEYLDGPATPPPPAPPSPGPSDSPQSSKKSLKLALKHRFGASSLSGLIVPDPSVWFWRSVRASVLARVRDIRPDLIITTSAPHSNHDIGMWLKRRTGIPWVADFRDPYVCDKRFTPRGAFAWMWPLHERYERAIYTHADLIIHNIPIDARWWRLRYPEARPKIRILTNACTPELAAGAITPDVTPGGRKSVRVIGVITDPELLRLAESVALLAERGVDVELRTVGVATRIKDQISRLLGDRAVFIEAVRHDLALRQVVGADVLINFLSPERASYLLVSSKLYEYIASGKPVIEVNPTISDRHFLRHIPDIAVLKDPTPEQLASEIDRALQLDVADLRARRAEVIAKNEWRSQVTILAGWFDEITGNARVSPSEPPLEAPLTRA